MSESGVKNLRRCVTVIGNVFLVLVVFVSLMPFLFDFKLTQEIALLWKLSYLAVAILIFAAIFSIRKVKVNFTTVVISFAAGGLGAYSIVFNAVPGLIHITVSEKESIKLNVSRKESGYQRGACTPRIYFKELTEPLFGYTCIPPSLFEKIQVKDRLCVTADVSELGISNIILIESKNSC